MKSSNLSILPGRLLSKPSSANDEMALHALAGSLSIAMVYHAAARGYSIKKVRSSFVGEINMTGTVQVSATEKNERQQIRVVVELEGEFTEQQNEEIRQLGTAFSPLFDILTNAVPIEVNIVNEDRA